MKKSDFETISCCICKGEQFTGISDEGKFGLPAYVSICEKCGLVQLNPRWTAKKYQDFYASIYDRYFREKRPGNKNIRVIINRFKKHNQFPGQVNRILDIGAGKGEAIAYLRQHVYPDAEYYAIEPSLDCQRELKQKEIRILASLVEENWENGNDKYDIIIMRHVLEHMMRPDEILRKVSGALSENGVFYFGVPNAMNPKYPVRNHHFRNVHTYYYSKFSLENLFRISGLRTNKIIEGDVYLKTELFGFASGSENVSDAIFDPDFVNSQKSAYFRRLKIEKRFFYSFFKFFEHRYQKYLTRIILVIDGIS